MFKKGFRFMETRNNILCEIVSDREVIDYYGEKYAYSVMTGDFKVCTILESTIIDNLTLGIYREVE